MGYIKLSDLMTDFFPSDTTTHPTVQQPGPEVGVNRNSFTFGEDTIGSAGLVLCCEGEYLLIKRTEEDGGHWSLPWGRIKENETPLEAVIRETKEEVGVILDVSEGRQRPELIGKVNLGRPGFIYHAECNEKPEIYLNHEHTDFKWVKASNLPKDTWEPVAEAIKRYDEHRKSKDT